MKRLAGWLSVSCLGLMVVVAGCSSDQQLTSNEKADGPFGNLAAVEVPVEEAVPGNGLVGMADDSLIEMVPYSSLSCEGLITFSDVTGGAPPGTNYDAVFESDGADFAERFAGQTLSIVDFGGIQHDVLSGAPSNPLSLQTGAANQNLNVTIAPSTNSQVLDGLSPQDGGFPSFNAIGEGAFAVLFDFDQSEFGFQLGGGNAGDATLNFFRRDGSLIETITISNLANISYGFSRVGGVNDIAGVSIHNLDLGGIFIDNICHDVPGVTGPSFALDIHPTSCPNPVNLKSRGVTPMAILGLGLDDVSEIDVSTIQIAGVSPVRSHIADVATPVINGEDCECNELEGDGIDDLTLKFKTQELLMALDLTPTSDPIPVTLTGQLLDGTPFEISDCIVLRGLPWVGLE
jgi:hypothetical protein